MISTCHVMTPRSFGLCRRKTWQALAPPCRWRKHRKQLKASEGHSLRSGFWSRRSWRFGSRRTPAKQIKLLFLQLLLHRDPRCPTPPGDPHCCLFAYTALRWPGQPPEVNDRATPVPASEKVRGQQSSYLLHRFSSSSLLLLHSKHTHLHKPVCFCAVFMARRGGKTRGNPTPHLLPVGVEWWSAPFRLDAPILRGQLCSAGPQIHHAGRPAGRPSSSSHSDTSDDIYQQRPPVIIQGDNYFWIIEIVICLIWWRHETYDKLFYFIWVNLILTCLYVLMNAFCWKHIKLHVNLPKIRSVGVRDALLAFLQRCQ